MPKTIGTFFTELALKAGVKSDDKSLKLMLENIGEASTQEMPDDLLGSMESNLHTLDSAKPKLKPILFAEALNGADNEITRILDEIQAPDDVKSGITAEKNTHKKIGLLTKAISDLEAKKATAKGGDKQQLIDEINNLKTSLASAVSAKAAEIKALQDQHEEQLTGFESRSSLSSYNLAFPDNLDKQIQYDTVMNAEKSQMQKDGVKVIRRDGQLVLVTAKDGSDYFDKSNNKIDHKSYRERFLAQNNLLKATDPAPAGQGGNPSGRQTIVPGTAGGLNTSSFVDALNSQIKELQAQ